MRKSRGTPKTLNSAIQNAFLAYKDEGVVSEQRLKKLLKIHLLDFNRNKLGVVTIVDGDSLSPESMKVIEILTEPLNGRARKKS